MNITLYSRKGWKLLRCERQTVGGRRRHSAILSHNLLLFSVQRCVIFKVPLSTSSASRSGGTQLEARCEPLCGMLPNQGAQPLAGILREQISSGCKPGLTVSHVGICIYHFTTLPRFSLTTWLLPPTHPSASCAEKSLIDGLVEYATRRWLSNSDWNLFMAYTKTIIAQKVFLFDYTHRRRSI